MRGLTLLRKLDLHGNLFRHAARSSKRLSRQLKDAKVTIIKVRIDAPPTEDAEWWRV